MNRLDKIKVKKERFSTNALAYHFKSSKVIKALIETEGVSQKMPRSCILAI